MRSIVYNGSPRGKRSNSKVLLDHFLGGLGEVSGDAPVVFYLARTKEREAQLQAFELAELVILTFPLYTDSMPGLVKAFIEGLGRYKGRPGSPKILFFVHSGFPEACHSRPLERYLEKLSRRLGCEYLGTLVKGGSEGIQIQPGWMTKKSEKTLRALGAHLARTETLDPELVAKLAGTERFGPFARMVMPIAFLMSKSYWKGQMKKNKARDRSFDRPYA